MKLALCQSPPTNGDEDAAFGRIARALSAAAHAGAAHAVLPELYLPGYNRPDLHAQCAQPAGGPWEQRFAELCRAADCGLTIGWAERHGDALFNSASTFDRTGAKLSHYRKRQLFGPMEKAGFTPGDAVPVFDLAGHRTAVLICYDVEFADLVQHLAEREVTLLLVPTANPAGFAIVSDVLVPARAYETSMTIAYANYCGAENGLDYGGKSLLAGPDGRPLATAGRGEALLVGALATPESLDADVLSTQRDDRRPLPGRR